MTTGLKYGHVLRALSSSMWAIYRPTFDLILELAEMRASGQAFTPEEITERLAAAKGKNGPRQGAQKAEYVAVVPIYGVISQRQNLMSSTSGGTSVEGIKAAFREAANDPEVGHIIFDIDSPGGTVDGIAELADEIRAFRGEKPMTSVVNTAMHSAALWLGTQADEIVSMPTGQMGSIGIIATHTDDSKAREQAGLKRTVMSIPAGKADGWGGDPISEDALGEIREMQEELYGMFTQAVSKGRNAPIKTVRDVWGVNARIFSAGAAQKNGLVDRIDTLDATIARAVRQLHRSNATQANGARVGLGAIPRLMSRQEVEDAGLSADVIQHGLEMIVESEGSAVAAPVYDENMAEGSGPDPVPDGEPADTEAEPQTAETPEDSGDPEPEQLASLPFAQRLVLVADEAEALADHARRRAAMRAEEGRGLSEETREQIQRIRHAFDGVDTGGPMVEVAGETGTDAVEDPEAPAPNRRAGVLDIYEAAVRGGYPLPN